ncbi:ABC transporter permease subunit [Ruminiclostridium josui]|uniref:ABC transporter permease subunit n=1 Tax=Ruminiclostridium josui TaxID=1499 RepID=UPI0004677799|nr:ABC transporter permease subunit [Ruminiclostridium josui]
MLIKYELLKRLRKKSTLIVMAVSLLITAFLFGLPVIQFQAYNQDGVIKGLKGIAFEKEQYSDLSIYLTDEYITETIGEVQELFENQDNVGYDGNEKFLIGDVYWNYIAPRESMLDMIALNYVNPGLSAGYNKLPEVDVSNGANFYRTREMKIDALLESPSRNLSKEKIDYWKDMNGKVKEPFQYGYHKAWTTIISCFELLIFPILAICIAVAPVFSGEYQAGMDAVLLSARYGKTRLATGKIISSLLFGVLAFTFHVIVAFGIPIAAYGVDGWNLPLQIAGTTIPYPFSFLQAVIHNLAVIYIVLIAIISLTLFLSAKLKSTYIVLAILVPALFIPIFLSPNGTEGLYNLILFLTTYRSTMPEFGKFISYQFGGIIMDVFTVRMILYVLLAAVMLPFARRCFAKHQVV